MKQKKKKTREANENVSVNWILIKRKRNTLLIFKYKLPIRF